MDPPTFFAMIARMSEAERRDRVQAEMTRALSLMRLAKHRVRELRRLGPKSARRRDAITEAYQSVEVLRELTLMSARHQANLERLFELQNATALLEIRCTPEDHAPRAAPIQREPEVIDLTGDDDEPASRAAPRAMEVIDLTQDD